MENAMGMQWLWVLLPQLLFIYPNHLTAPSAMVTY